MWRVLSSITPHWPHCAHCGCLRICVRVGETVPRCVSAIGRLALAAASALESQSTQSHQNIVDGLEFCSADQLCLVRCAVKLRLRSET